MRRIKRGLAMLLTVLMLISSTSPLSFAEENVLYDTVKALEEENVIDDEISYNLGNKEITVGYDMEKAESEPLNYQLFDENGNYTIQLEDNAFFPYEVQFTSGSAITAEWFETPDSTVQIGRHTFSVYSEQNDDTKISQIGFWIDGEYVAARPEPKTFTNPRFQMFSLIPLTEVRVNVDLTSYNYFQLKDVQVSAIISGMDPTQTIDSSDKVVWSSYYYNDKEYKIVEQTDKMDLTEFNSNSFDVEMIVGSALQLDTTNIRYIVDITKNSDYVIEGANIYKSVGGIRSKVTPIGSYNYNNSYGGVNQEITNYLSKTDINADSFYFGLTLNSKYSTFDNIKVYSGIFETVEAAENAVVADPSIDVTDKVLNQDMTQDGTGVEIITEQYQFWYWEDFTFVFEEKGVKNLYGVEVGVSSDNGVYAYNNLYGSVSTYNDIVDYNNVKWQDEVEIYTYTLEQGYSADELQFLRLEYIYGGSISPSNRVYITKAVVGHFDTIEAAEGAADIKDQLFPLNMNVAGSGYQANYSGNGQNFTIFAEGDVYKITIKAVDGEPQTVKAPLPNPGSNDTYFRVNGADGLYNTYVLPYEHDTYYDMGYQTVFYTDDVDLSTLKPIFFEGNLVNVYSGHNGAAGTLQESGKTVVDFSKGPAQYAVAAENGKDLKNYWVTFVKKHTGGPKLFVNGINGPDGSKREVFLTTVHDNIHDIFFANVGDTSLTGINATLTNAQNIKLDPYWTVGGTNNDTLAAFDSTYIRSSFSELANVAKIRLIPDGEGEIKGTLTITADGQEPVVITLTGNAGNPKLTTAEIPEAVKYVPYAVQILHNNKYSWNTVTMNMTSGKLPDGVILKPNGELYGVPKETGSFRFGVQMTNSDTRFGRSSATYTLLVKDNTNTNVDLATDIGYEVTTRVGIRVGDDDVITVLDNHEFVTQGEIGEFIDFWLNGEKLVKNIDYTEEAGSTKITILSQTFQNKANKSGSNTIAAEFRVDGDENKELKRAAQNFKIDLSGGSGGNSGGNQGGGSSDPSTPSDTTPTPKPKPEQIITAPNPIIKLVEVPTTVDRNIATADGSIEGLKNALSGAINELGEAAGDAPRVIELVVTGITSDVNEIIVVVPVASIQDMTDTTLRLNAGHLGTITLNKSALNSIIEQGGETVKINIAKDNSEVAVKITVDGVTINKVNGGIRVALPNLAVGEVIVLVRTDGGEEIVKKSFVEDGNVYALLSGSGTIKVINNAKNFIDIKSSDWFYNSILFVNSRVIFIGVSEDEFAPKLPMTRAMLATALHRLENKVDSNAQVTYTDVLQEQWYSDSIAWAVEAGIVSGYGNGVFGTNDNINREQLATIMYNYAKYTGLSTVERGGIQHFSDAEQTSPWATDALRWAVGIGLMQGDGNNLNPKGDASRADVATIIMRFVEIMVK